MFNGLTPRLFTPATIASTRSTSIASLSLVSSIIIPLVVPFAPPLVMPSVPTALNALAGLGVVTVVLLPNACVCRCAIPSLDTTAKIAFQPSTASVCPFHWDRDTVELDRVCPRILDEVAGGAVVVAEGKVGTIVERTT